MSTNLRSGFNRLFVVLTFVWAVYWLLGYPIQRQRQVDKVFKVSFTTAWMNARVRSSEAVSITLS